jgi:hypothetical protein
MCVINCLASGRPRLWMPTCPAGVDSLGIKWSSVREALTTERVGRTQPDPIRELAERPRRPMGWK